MSISYSTGNEIVDQVGEINFIGNIVPTAWFSTMKGNDGKPYWLAILILSDIVYWYRPTEIRDEASGNLVGYRKRFKADLLQRSYAQLCSQFGISKKQARAALDYLEGIGVVIKRLRNEITRTGAKLHNNMYLELVPSVLRELTYPQFDKEVVPSGVPPSAPEDTRVVTYEGPPGSLEGMTSTKNTTEISNKDYINPIYRDLSTKDEMDKIEIYREIIKDNIDYDILVHDNKGLDKENIDEMVELMAEVAGVERDKVLMGGEYLPYQHVKGKLLKVNSGHIRYVLDCLKNCTTKRRNIKNYLLTCLYNAPSTINNYHQAEVNHDFYGK